MVRCPRDDRVAVPLAMIHLLPCTVDHGLLVRPCQQAGARSPKSVAIRKFGFVQELDFVREHYGLPCSICHLLPTGRPNQCPLFSGSPFDEQMLSVTKTNCRSLSRLYEIREGTRDLYNKVGSFLSNSSRN